MTAIASLVSAIMLGSFETFIKGFNPVGYLYSIMFNEEIPDYLFYGFFAIGNFYLIYSLASVVISPVACRVGARSTEPDFETPNVRDLMFLPILYLVYLLAIYSNYMLTAESSTVGLFAITLPIAYRLVVYFISDRFSALKTSCYFNLYVFLISIFMSIPVTIVYLLVIKYLIISF